jgi:hypothetical protein
MAVKRVGNVKGLPMVRFSPSLTRASRWFLAVTAVVGSAYLLLIATRTFLSPLDCDTTELGKVFGVLGLDIEISETDCWHDPLISIRAIKPGSPDKTIVLQYSDWGRTMPVITTPDDQTIQISIPRVSFISCQRDTWKTLTFKYDIGLVEHPSGKQKQC